MATQQQVNPQLLDEVLRSADRLHHEADVECALDRMAQEIEAELGGRMPVILGVMIGALIPLGKLLPRLQFPLEVDYIHATRYHRSTRGADLVWLARPQTSLRDRTVLVVDDILDEGRTLAGIIDECHEQGAREVLAAVLVNKHHARRFEGIEANFYGLDVEDRYVFGAGMDYKGYFRNLAGIYAVKQELED